MPLFDEVEFRKNLELQGEAVVRAAVENLSPWSEGKRHFARVWLIQKEMERQRRVLRWTVGGAIAAAVAAVASALALLK